MTERQLKLRARCPYVELIGGEGYVCNRQGWQRPDGSFLPLTENGSDVRYKPFKDHRKCFGCSDIERLTNTK